MIELTTVSFDDIRFFYDVKCDPDNMYWCDSTKPLYGNIERFLTNVIEKKEKYANRSVFVISSEQVKMGYVYVDEIGLTAEISIAVMLRYAGRGVASQVLRILEEKYIGSHVFTQLVAWIRDDNMRSLHVFEKAGWVASGLKKEKRLANTGRIVFMIEYIKDGTKQHARSNQP